MRKIVITALLLFTTLSFAQNTIPVTFSVDMGVAAFKGQFNPASDQVVIRGSFQADAGDPGGNWQGNLFAMTDNDGDTIYTLTVDFPNSTAGNTYEFKFVIAPDGWEGSPNRTFTVTAPGVVLPTYWFNNDSLYRTAVTNTFNFTADISGILGIGLGGAFDPNSDSLLVMGMTWSGNGTVLNEGNRRLFNTDPFNPGIYTTSLDVAGFLGANEEWKFKAYPDNRFANTGWEDRPNRVVTFEADGTTQDLGVIVPEIFPLLAPLNADVNVQITVDMTGAVNFYNGEPVPIDQIEFVGMRGGADFLGSWNSGGCWCAGDTATGQMKVLSRIPNTNKWTITVTAPAGTNAGNYAYKFGVMYPGADTVNGGSNPLDNEAGFGQNHRLFLFQAPGGLIVINNRFGDFTSSVDQISDLVPAAYQLEQNYPNPFNPVTTIRYSVPKQGQVSLKVYNILGQEVVTLVDQQQSAGTYEVKFGAPNMASGMYFYTLEADGVKLTRKMMLVK